MLKSTHRQSATTQDHTLPSGWSEHRAPTGHVYYYNAETKQSTYTKPVHPDDESELLIDYGATAPDREMQASLTALQQFQKNNVQVTSGAGIPSSEYRNFNSYRPNRQGDRPKSKTAIPDCAPWVLVKTKYGRRFVHNTETKESFWKFPSEVMMAVIDMDRIEWQKKSKITEEKKQAQEKKNGTPKTNDGQPQPGPSQADFDSDEYEEVEVTDDEAAGEEDRVTKKPRVESIGDQNTEANPSTGPQEFDEDDIAWQLAQMEADDEDPGYDYDLEGDDDEEGLPLTKDDREALFRQLLDEHHISPFSTFDALIDTNTATANAVISDDRWTTLPNMGSRRTAFDAWSRDRVAARQNDNEEQPLNGTANHTTMKQQKLDPRVTYLRFLSREATAKLYWPEFKRKFRKSPEMLDRYLPDKDREKLYREYVAKLKLSDTDRLKEFNTLLRNTPREQWSDHSLPISLEKSLQFYGVRDEQRRSDLAEAFRSTLRHT